MLSPFFSHTASVSQACLRVKMQKTMMFLVFYSFAFTLPLCYPFGDMIIEKRSTKKPSLSVVIPVFQAKDFLGETVSRIESVSHVPEEIILVDDGSTDGSAGICDTLRSHYVNIVVIHQENKGIAEARNAGINAATGDYICFVDQDDLVEPVMYETALRSAVSVNADLVMMSTGQVVQGQKLPYESLPDATYMGEEVQNRLLPAFLFRGYVNPKRESTLAASASIWKCVIRTDLLRSHQLRFHRFISYEDDYLMVLSLLCYAKTAVTCPEIGYYWVIHSSSESHSRRHITQYTEKTAQMVQYIRTTMQNAGISEDQTHIFLDQLVFEKTLDAIANSYLAKDTFTKEQKKQDVLEYLNRFSIFSIRPDHVEPLPRFHRLRFLFHYYKKGNPERLISSVCRFLRAEARLQQMPFVAKLLRK